MTRTRTQGTPQNDIAIEDLQPGDVVHSYIWEDDEYVHSGICLSQDEIAHFVYEGGDIVPPNQLIGNRSRLDVYRSHAGIWTPDRLVTLDTFSRECVGTSYDYVGAGALEESKHEHQSTIRDKLERFAKGKLNLPPIKSSKYFCSQFIVCCFAYAGIIGESAQVLYDPKTYSPEGLADDPTFGLPVGYIEIHRSKLGGFR